MKQKARHLLHLLLGTLLGWLGFSSCEELSGILDPGGGMCMYGTPTVGFEAKGKVTDRFGNGIEGVRVAVRQHSYTPNTAGVVYDQNHWYKNDTLYTNASGQYELHTRVTGFTGPDDVTIVFEDVDGAAHGGEYASQTVLPTIKQIEKGDNRWYNGTYSVEADVKLKKK